MRRKSLLIIFLSVFIDLFGFGVVLPLLPRYAERFGATGIWIGLIIASYSIMQFFFAPWWGRLSDLIGRRPVILISNAGASGSYLLFGVASLLTGSEGLALLLVSRIFAGICGANLSVASAYIADITPPEKRSQGMGLIGLAFGLGFILGPAIGSLGVSLFGLAGPGWIAAALCGGNFIFGFFFLAESRTRTGKLAPARPKYAQWWATLKQPRMGFLIGIYFLSTFCFASLESTLPLLLGSPTFHPEEIADPVGLARKIDQSDQPTAAKLRELLSPEVKDQMAAAQSSPRRLRRLFFGSLNELIHGPKLFPEQVTDSLTLRPETASLLADSQEGDQLVRLNRLLLEDAFPEEIQTHQVHYDERRMGYLFAYCGLIAAIIQGGVIGRLVRRFGEERLIFGSLLILGVSLALVPYAGGLAMLLVGLGLFSAGSGINRPPTMGLISMYSSSEEQGVNLGVAQSAGTMARIAGPMFATLFYKVSPNSPYLICAFIAVIAGFVTYRVLCQSPRRENQPASKSV